jgi:hypothetical protein
MLGALVKGVLFAKQHGDGTNEEQNQRNKSTICPLISLGCEISPGNKECAIVFVHK